jgi:hypothetical protein
MAQHRLGMAEFGRTRIERLSLSLKVNCFAVFKTKDPSQVLRLHSQSDAEGADEGDMQPVIDGCSQSLQKTSWQAQLHLQ